MSAHSTENCARTRSPTGACSMNWLWATAGFMPHRCRGDHLIYVGGSDGILRAIESAASSPTGSAALPAREKPAASAGTVKTIPPATVSNIKPSSYDEALRLARVYMDEEGEAKRREVLR